MSKCLECGYYNKEKHYCPFYCQLIRETLNEAISFELEQIKEEMNVELFKEYSAEREFDSGYESCLKQQIDRIDNHIKELKGEQK